MKKIIPILVLGMFVINGFGVLAMSIEKSSLSQPEFRIIAKSGFGLNLIIENIGDAYAYDTRCFISFILFKRSWQGPFPSSDSLNLGAIAPGQSRRVHFRTVGLGFGVFSDSPNLYIEVGCAEQSYSQMYKYANVIGKIIILQ